MSYKEKYLKYKQKYLNHLSNIDLLKGGNMEEVYRLMDIGQIRPAVKLLEDMQRDKNPLISIRATNYLIDIFAFGRLGIPPNEEKYKRCKSFLQNLEEQRSNRMLKAGTPKSDLPPNLSYGVNRMEVHFGLFGARQQKIPRDQLPQLFERANRERDTRLKFLWLDAIGNTENLTDSENPKLNSDDMKYELTLTLLCKIKVSNCSDVLHFSEIPANRGVIEAIYRRGKAFLDQMSYKTLREAMSCFLNIRECHEKLWSELADVSLFKMNYYKQEKPTIQLATTDRFVFDVSNLDNKITIVRNLCFNLLNTGLYGKTLHGDITGSYMEARSVGHSNDAETELWLPKKSDSEEKRESAAVDMLVSCGITENSFVLADGGTLYIFSGDGNDILDGLEAPATGGANIYSIYNCTRRAVERFPCKNFVIVSFEAKLNPKYLALARIHQNLKICYLSEFIRRIGINFIPKNQQLVAELKKSGINNIENHLKIHSITEQTVAIPTPSPGGQAIPTTSPGGQAISKEDLRGRAFASEKHVEVGVPPVKFMFDSKIGHTKSVELRFPPDWTWKKNKQQIMFFTCMDLGIINSLEMPPKINKEAWKEKILAMEESAIHSKFYHHFMHLYRDYTRDEEARLPHTIRDFIMNIEKNDYDNLIDVLFNQSELERFFTSF
jgi:hypothetical protein